ncbi:hypothetical protein DFH09DRAFT_1299554 [Mycena vulgaris]|nr:hypothetical protein DFH09DRAFT_1299554 [Mycena vulgaris]
MSDQSVGPHGHGRLLLLFPASMVNEYHGEPRLDTGDVAFLESGPPQILQAFRLHETWGRRSLDWHRTLAVELVQDQALLQGKIYPWVEYYIAFELDPEEAALLFVQVLWWRFLRSDAEALAVLVRRQVKAYKELCGPKVNIHNEHVGATTSNPEVLIPGLKELVQTDHEQQCTEWNLELRNFFCLESPSATVNENTAVSILQHMRLVSRKTYRSRLFMDAFKKSGLSDTLAILTDPLTRREVNFPHIQRSNRKHHWREFFGELHDRFTPPQAQPAAMPPKPSGKLQERINVTMFFTEIMADERFLLSMNSSAQNVYFLSSLENWQSDFVNWVGPTIRSMAVHCLPPVETWAADLLFRDICQAQVSALSPCAKPGWPLAKDVLLEAQRERQQMKKVNQHAHRPVSFAPLPLAATEKSTKGSPSAGRQVKRKALGSKTPRNIQPDFLSYDEAVVEQKKGQGCPRCAGKAKDALDRCVRTISRKRCSTAELELMRDALLTCAAPNDIYMTPAGSTLHPKVLNPDRLRFLELAPRKTVKDTCGKDVTLVEEEETCFLIGGVEFWPFDDETLDALREGHDLVATYAKAASRTTKMQLGGTLIPLGNRLAKGGSPGDGYGPYACQTAEDSAGVKALFAAARDSDSILTAVGSMAPDVVREIKERKKASGLNNMGRTGMNSFYCWEYAAPLHKDEDDRWSLCCQLWKDGCQADEYNFAYAEWGVYIRTQANCVWFFNPHHLHGTILPRQSSVDTAISRGTLATVRCKDLEKARVYESARQSYNSCVAFWDSYSAA